MGKQLQQVRQQDQLLRLLQVGPREVRRSPNEQEGLGQTGGGERRSGGSADSG